MTQNTNTAATTQQRANGGADFAVRGRIATLTQSVRCASALQWGDRCFGPLDRRRIRDGKGWLALGYATWALCCEEEFGYSKNYANRLIKAEEISRQVGPIGPTPLNESQARELGKVPEERRQAVVDWAEEKAEQPQSAVSLILQQMGAKKRKTA